MQKSYFSLAAFFLIGFGILSTLLLVAGLNGANGQVQAQQKIPVKVQPARLLESFNHFEYALGRVESAQTTLLGFDLAGQINQLNAEEGDTVNAGDVMAVLDLDRLDAQIQQAQSALVRANADANLASLTKNRVASLVEKGLESNQRLDDANANFDVTVAAKNQAQAALNSLLVEQEKSVMVAPYAGTIIRRHQDTGAVVNASQAVFTLQANNQTELRVALPPKLAKSLQVGDTVKLKNQPFQATLIRFVQRQDSNTRTQDAIFAVNTQDWRPLSGELHAVEVEVSTQGQGMWLPLSALSSGIRGMWTVFAVEGSEDARVATRLVSVIHTEGDRAFVSGALAQDDRVVVEGTQRLVPGQLVQVIGG